MFDKLLNKGAGQVAAAGPQRAGAPAAPAASESELQAWRERIAAAKADDQALLQLAREAPEIDLKLAARNRSVLFFNFLFPLMFYHVFQLVLSQESTENSQEQHKEFPKIMGPFLSCGMSM